MKVALDAWTVGSMAATAEGVPEMPADEVLRQRRREALQSATIEAVVLEREGQTPIRYRALSDEEVRSAIRT